MKVSVTPWSRPTNVHVLCPPQRNGMGTIEGEDDDNYDDIMKLITIFLKKEIFFLCTGRETPQCQSLADLLLRAI